MALRQQKLINNALHMNITYTYVCVCVRLKVLCMFVCMYVCCHDYDCSLHGSRTAIVNGNHNRNRGDKKRRAQKC